MLTLAPPVITADAVDAAKTYLRIDGDVEDGLIAALLAASLRHAEAFISQLMLRRSGVDRLPTSSAWQRLGVTPVQSITEIVGIPNDGASFILQPAAYALDIDHSGDGWVRISSPGNAAKVDVSVIAGVAADWDAIPEPIQLAVLRLTAHLHAFRDATDDAGPPAAVAALLRPFRRVRLV